MLYGGCCLDSVTSEADCRATEAVYDSMRRHGCNIRLDSVTSEVDCRATEAVYDSMRRHGCNIRLDSVTNKADCRASEAVGLPGLCLTVGVTCCTNVSSGECRRLDVPGLVPFGPDVVTNSLVFLP